MTTDRQPPPRRRRAARRSGWFSGIRIRVLTIALIPSVALFITGTIVVSSLVSNALSERNFASVIGQNIGAVIELHDAIEDERTTSLLALGGDQQAMVNLPSVWKQTNVIFQGINQAAANVGAVNSSDIASGVSQLLAAEKNVALLRQAVQARKATATEVDTDYTALASANTNALVSIARTAPSSDSAVDLTTTLQLLTYLDDHSRVVGLGGGWAAGHGLTNADRVTLAQLFGTYQNGLQQLTGTYQPGVQSPSELPPDEQATYNKLVTGNAWKVAVAGEESLNSTGKLNVPLNTWLSDENTVSTGLLSLWNTNFRFGESAAESVANQTLGRSILLGTLALVLTIAAFSISLLLANTLARRLRRLRNNTLELADVRLPSMVRRVGEGQPVDVDAELAVVDSGNDEIGQVAAAFNTAQRTAVTAAAAEAATRSGINKVFLDIAHRSQLVVHRQLEVLDVAEARQGDPDHLDLLFQLDHLATRARRNAENLLILGGGQPGRRWRQPAGLEDVVRSAVSETENYARVDTVRLPEVRVQGALVGDLIHLLAELVDNATAFSPPDSVVTVRGNMVGKGVVVEIDDQGLGIEEQLREQFNETLRNPPGFQAMALSGDRHLGLFVVGQLAHRHGVSVSLVESAYGGIRAIVLIPADAIERGSAPDAGLMTGDLVYGNNTGRHEQSATVTAQAVRPTTLSRLGSDDDVTPSRANRQAPVAQNHSAQNHIGQNRAAQNHAAQNHASQNNSGQANAGQNRSGQPNAGQPNAGQPNAGQSNAGQNHSGQNHSGQNHSGADPLPKPPWEVTAAGSTPGPSRRERRPLPRRERQTNMAPELRLDNDPEAPRAAPSRPRRTPEEAHGSMSAFQRGTRLGRDIAGVDIAGADIAGEDER